MPRGGSNELHAGDSRETLSTGAISLRTRHNANVRSFFQGTVLRRPCSLAVHSACYDSSVATTSPGT